MIGDEIVEDSKIIAEVVANEVLMNDETNDKELMAFPTFKNGDFRNSVYFVKADKAMGPDGLPDNFFEIRYMTEKKAHIIEKLERRPDLVKKSP